MKGIRYDSDPQEEVKPLIKRWHISKSDLNLLEVKLEIDKPLEVSLGDEPDILILTMNLEELLGDKFKDCTVTYRAIIPR